MADGAISAYKPDLLPASRKPPIRPLRQRTPRETRAYFIIMKGHIVKRHLRRRSQRKLDSPLEFMDRFGY
jgi:hypothetical protein